LGTPAKITWTVLLNPFCAVTEIVIGAPVAPWEMDNELEESVMAKSGEGVEGGLLFDDGLLLLPPPHPAQMSRKGIRALRRARFGKWPTLRSSAQLSRDILRTVN
jgi:hypothetical protein